MRFGSDRRPSSTGRVFGVAEQRQAILLPYVPRLAVDWLAHAPEETFREVDGTMVFIDISGFTKLSERLAAAGKQGAENLTDILNGVFTRLLDLSYERGGGLVKFGGDALLLLFTGDSHASRACEAAVLMREELREIGRVATPSGTVRLRMSVGVHSGKFHFFLVGQSHRELLLSGPAATHTVEMEGTADAGEILISKATAALIDAVASGGEKGEGNLLRRAPFAQRWAWEEPGSTALDIGGCVPLVLRRHLVSGGVEAEHRQVVIAFIRFMGVDELLARDGPPAVAEALDEFVAAVQRAADDHGVCFLGSDIYEDGGKVILTAGAPEATGSDEERMLRAVRAIIDVDLTLGVRAGINAGHVYSGEVGHSHRRTYTVMGDAVNLAARLMQAAPVGEILATERVLDRSRTAFEAVPLEPFYVKGKAKPVQAHSVGAIIGLRRQGATNLPMVGRELESEALRAALASASEGRGQVIELIGEAGIGKSRLLEELRRANERTAWFDVSCDQYEVGTPFHSIRELLVQVLALPPAADAALAGTQLRRVVERVEPDLLPLLPLLAIPLDAQVPSTPEVDQLDPRFRKAQVERAVTRLLLAAVPTGVIAFEDAHWMDEASSDVLRLLCEEAATARLLICVTRRDVDGGFHPQPAVHVRPLHLHPLEPAALQALADMATEQLALASYEVSALAERAGGNPLFLLELATGAAQTGGVDALPETIEAAVCARIDQLAPPDRAVLRAASVLGMAFSAELASSVVSEAGATTWPRLGEFLVEDRQGQLRFRQALIRDTAYEGLPYRRRRALHRKVGERLEASDRPVEEHVELLALHFFRGQQFDRAWRYSRVAGERAKAKSASVEAARFFRQALDAANSFDGEIRGEELAEVSEALGDMCQLAGFYAEGARAYRLARGWVRDDPARVADLLKKEGRIRHLSGAFSLARRWYRRGSQAVDELSDDEVRRAIKVQLDVVYMATLAEEGRYRACIKKGRQVLEDAQAVGDLRALAHAYYLLDWACTESGIGEASQYRGLALPIYEELGDLVGQANALNNMGNAAFWEGKWAEALELYRRSRAAREKAGDIALSAMAATNIGEVLSDQGRLPEAEKNLREALRIVRSVGHRLGTAWVTSNLGVVAARQGRIAEAADLLDEARERFREIGAEARVLETNARIAEAQLLAGEWSEALALIEETLDGALRLGGLPFLVAALHRLRAYAAAHASDPESALEALAKSERVAREANAGFELALTLRARAEIASRMGAADDAAAQESERILRLLDVVAPPEIPLRPLAGGPLQ